MARVNLPFFIARRYARSQRKKGSISFITIVSALGLVLGVAILVIVVSVMNGFDRELRERILGLLPQASIRAPGGLDDWQRVAAVGEHEDSVIAAAPYVQGPALVVARGEVRGVSVWGLLPSAERRVSILEQFMAEGGLDALVPGEFGAAIGTTLARELGVGVGDSVTLVMPQATFTLAGLFPRQKRMRVVALFETGAEADSGQVFVHLHDAQRLFRRGAVVDGVKFKLVDLFQARAVLQEILDALENPRLRASDWMRTHGNLYSAIQLQKVTLAILLTLLVAVAAFNVVSSLVMLVTEKQAEIAILRTMGGTPRTVMWVFAWQGMFIGGVGVALGLALGVALTLVLSDLYAWFERLSGVALLGQYFVHYLPTQLRWADLALITTLALATSALSTVYPARRASHVRPAEVLRYE
jgi:lipoprotein-releasing system permease protein